MDRVLKDALAAVARAEAALADAEQQLRAAWSERLVALESAGWSVAYCHDVHREPITQRLAVLDAAGRTVDVDALAALATGR